MNLISTSVLSKNPLFKNFMAASTVSLLGTNIFDIAMPLYVLERTHSVIALSLANVALTLPYFLMAPLTGYMVDHFDKRKVMLSTDLGQVLCLSVLMIYEQTSAHQLWPILLTVFVAKTLMIIFETVVTFQLIPALVESGDLSAANTWFLSAQRFIQIMGPVSGGILMSLWGIQGCIIINIVSFGATLFFVYKLKNLSALIDGPNPIKNEGFKNLRPQKLMSSFVDSIRYIWHSKTFKPFIFLMFFWNLSSLCPNTPSIIYYFTEYKNFSPAQYGMVVSLFGVLGILGFLSSVAFYKQFSFPNTFRRSYFVHVVLASCSLMFLKFPVVLAIVFAISRFGSSIVSMGTFLLRQTRVPKARAGGVNACLRMFFMSAAPLSAFLQGLIIDTWGVMVSFILGAGCLWGAYFYAKKSRQLLPRESVGCTCHLRGGCLILV